MKKSKISNITPKKDSISNVITKKNDISNVTTSSVPWIILYLNSPKCFRGSYKSFMEAVLQRGCGDEYSRNGVSILRDDENAIPNVAICYDGKKILLHIQNCSFYLLGLNVNGKEDGWFSIKKIDDKTMPGYKRLNIGEGYSDLGLPNSGDIANLELGLDQLIQSFKKIHTFLSGDRSGGQQAGFRLAFATFIFYFCEGGRFGEVFDVLYKNHKNLVLGKDNEKLIKNWASQQESYFKDLFFNKNEFQVKLRLAQSKRKREVEELVILALEEEQQKLKKSKNKH